MVACLMRDFSLHLVRQPASIHEGIAHAFFHSFIGGDSRNGAGDRTRTCNPLITSEVLYQLSYTSKVVACLY